MTNQFNCAASSETRRISRAESSTAATGSECPLEKNSRAKSYQEAASRFPQKSYPSLFGTRRGVGPRNSASRAGRVDSSDLSDLRPSLEEISRRPAIIHERKRQTSASGVQVGLDPVRHSRQFAGCHELHRPSGTSLTENTQDHEDEQAGSSRTTCAGNHVDISFMYTLAFKATSRSCTPCECTYWHLVGW